MPNIVALDRDGCPAAPAGCDPFLAFVIIDLAASNICRHRAGTGLMLCHDCAARLEPLVKAATETELLTSDGEPDRHRAKRAYAKLGLRAAEQVAHMNGDESVGEAIEAVREWLDADASEDLAAYSRLTQAARQARAATFVAGDASSTIALAACTAARGAGNGAGAGRCAVTGRITSSAEHAASVAVADSAAKLVAEGNTSMFAAAAAAAAAATVIALLLDDSVAAVKDAVYSATKAELEAVPSAAFDWESFARLWLKRWEKDADYDPVL